MLTYAGIPLCLPSAEVAAWVEANLSPAQVYEYFGGFRGTAAWLRLREPEPPPRVRVGTLDWPTGAARFAAAHFLADRDAVEAIRPRVYLPYRPADLVLDDGTYRVTAPLWLLPPRPLAEFKARENVPYLLSLVDDRYFWWDRAATIAVSTWPQLYADLGAALGVTITPDPIPAAYLSPPAAYAAAYECLPPLLDEVAEAVGQRIVRGYGGAVRAMNAASARALVLQNLNQGWPAAAGGQLAISWQ